MMRYCVYGKNNQSIKLDPRTKLLLCLCISVTLIAGSSAGVLRYPRAGTVSVYDLAEKI